jgi:hypothetical protein
VRRYQRISGEPYGVQVSSPTPDTYGSETGLGKLNFFQVTGGFASVKLDAVGVGYDVSFKANVSPVTNNAAWIASTGSRSTSEPPAGTALS